MLGGYGSAVEDLLAAWLREEEERAQRIVHSSQLRGKCILALQFGKLITNSIMGEVRSN